MKKALITLALISMAGMALFAEGSKENNSTVPNTGYMGRGYAAQNYNGQMPGNRQMPNGSWNGNNNQSSWGPGAMFNSDAESMTLTGKLDLTDVNDPKLTVGENTYELMVPYRLDYDMDIKDGDEITINGFEVPGYGRDTNPDLTNLMVTGATFNGKEYSLDADDMGYRGRGMDYDDQRGRGRRPGRSNNRFQPNGMRNSRYCR